MPMVLLQAEDLQALEQAGNADAGYEDNCERPMEVSMIPYIEGCHVETHKSAIFRPDMQSSETPTTTEGVQVHPESQRLQSEYRNTVERVRLVPHDSLENVSLTLARRLTGFGKRSKWRNSLSNTKVAVKKTKVQTAPAINAF